MCVGIYNLYSGTLFEKKHLRPSQEVVLLFLRGVAKGESSMRLAEEQGVSRSTGYMSCARSYSGAPGDFNRRRCPLWVSIPRPMRCSRTRGKQGDRYQEDLDDPPRRRANNNERRGHGNYENDRPPIVGRAWAGKRER